MNEQIVLGSGKLYIMALPADGVVPATSTIETEANRLGYIKGGASLEYKPTELQVADDSGTFTKRYVISEETTFKSGVLTWNTQVLNMLSQANSYVDSNGTRTLKLGGVGAREMSKYIIHFVHDKDASNSIKITLVGTASSGFSLAFAADAETVIDAEFKAVSQDASGTQVVITETYTAE